MLGGGGDECVALVCENYQEATSFLIGHLQQEYHMEFKKFEHPNSNYVAASDRSQEGFVISNKAVNLPFGEYNFYISKDCVSYCGTKILKAYKNA